MIDPPTRSRSAPPPIPRWVLALVGLAVLVALAVAATHLAGSLPMDHG